METSGPGHWRYSARFRDHLRTRVIGGRVLPPEFIQGLKDDRERSMREQSPGSPGPGSKQPKKPPQQPGQGPGKQGPIPPVRPK